MDVECPQPLRILVLETDASLRQSLERSLRVRRAVVEARSDAPAAARLLSAFHPDLVLGDAGALGGLPALGPRAARSGPVVIAMLESGTALPDGADVALHKPLTAQRLDRALEAALRLRQAAG